MIYKCAFCNKEESMQKWFVCPGTVYRPNMYSVCDDHKDLSLKWEDVYPDHLGMSVLKHHDKTEDSTDE